MNSSDKDSPRDAFTELGLARCLVLDPETLESTWRRLSQESHPDTEEGDATRAAAVHRAYGTLKAPAARLRHWLELHEISPPDQTGIDPDLMSLFADAGSILHEADALSKKKSATTTALTKALLAESEFAVQKKLQDLMQRLQQENSAITDRFEAFQESGSAGDFQEAAAAAGRLAFLEKWAHQCRERLLALMTSD